jgi:hypothetical protein
MEDVYYNKYIKYKTKYLELKELNGGVNFLKNIYNTFTKKTKEQPSPIQPPILIQEQPPPPIQPPILIQEQLTPIQQSSLIQQSKQPPDSDEETIANKTFSDLTESTESTEFSDLTESTESTESIISNRSNYGNQYNKINEKIVLFKEAYKINEEKLEDITLQEKNISTDELKEKLHNNKNIYKIKIIDNIVSIEDYLLNTLLPELYNNVFNKDIHNNFIIIYINICRIIINYREYFYSKHNYNEEYINSIKQNIEDYIINIKNKLNFGNLKLKILKNIIELYFKNVNDSIKYLDSFTYKSKNWEIDYSNKEHYKDNDCLFTFINNNIINFTENSIFTKIKITFAKILNNKEGLKKKTISLYNIKEILKIYVLITFKNNIHINNIDNIMMLINCNLIIINNREILKDDANLNNLKVNDLYLQNLLFKKKEKDDFSFDQVFYPTSKQVISEGGGNEEQIIKSNCGIIDNFMCGMIMDKYYNCDKKKYNILYIFERLETILKIDITKKKAEMGYRIFDTKKKLEEYDIKNLEERINFNKQLKDDIEKYFQQYFKNNEEILKIMKNLIV